MSLPLTKSRHLHHFHGGLHLPDHKLESTLLTILEVGVPPLLTLPLQQHIGHIAEPVVKVGDLVKKGQLIAQAEGFVSAPLHAPSSGRIQAIEERTFPHPSGLPVRSILIETDGLDEWGSLPEPLPDFEQTDRDLLLERIRWAGIVGLGGAAFPTSVKLSPGKDKKIRTLILNGAECEPYITCDDMLMREHADRVVAGLAVMRHILSPNECLIGIEDNKPEAIEAMREALRNAALESTEVIEIPTKYPSGGEKQLIYILTGEEVPSQHIPADIGIVCHNVGTAAAVADAVIDGKPLISRTLTLGGDALKQAQNVHAPLGASMHWLIEQIGGYKTQAKRLVMGGPMMGVPLRNDDYPIVKGSNCLLALSPEQTPPEEPARPCIRCGECARVCPVELLPQQLYWYTRAKDFDEVQSYDLFDCIECGCCAYVCPSHIPLVQYYRYAKSEIWAQEEEKKKADLARQRHEARQARLARLEQERKARLRKKKDALEKRGANKADDPKKAAIQAALKRVEARKAAKKASQTTTEAPNGDSTS